MAIASLAGRGWRRTLTLTAGLLMVSGLIVSNLPGQTGKKTATKKPAPEKELPKAIVADKMVTESGVEQVAYINEAIQKAWDENKIKPSDRCSDYEFIRRASLDIVGRIATVPEIQVYLNDPPERRRSMLIERLLKSPEYKTNWANVWTVLLLTRRGVSKVYQDQMRDWLEEKLESPAAAWDKIVTEIITASGQTNDNGSVNFILAHVGEGIKGDKGTMGAFDMVPVTSRTTRLFLGLRTQCVQCHDHPFNGDWKQEHFWGINAFFRQVEAPKGRPTMMPQKAKKAKFAQQFTLEDNPDFNRRGIVPYERRSGVLLYTDPTFLDGRKMPKKGFGSRRAALADFITKSPYFSKAFVNRMWGHLFGRSFTKDAVDDFGDHNPASHPELLDKIAEDWATKYQHNPRDLIRWICNSRAYGLSSVANKTNDKPEDESFFARMLLKAMTPEQLFDSLMTATQAKVGQSKASKAKLRENWLARLVLNFGDDEGNETSFNGTVIQALLLMNGQDINDAIMDKEVGTVAVVLKKRAYSANAARGAMTDLYLAALNRPPSAAEFARILNPRMYLLPKSGPPRDPAAFWTGFYQDLFWAILNSNEFILNH
jgi:hypothetical protein